MATRVPISEIFGPTVQGEGYLIGRRTMFIRTAGCDGVSGQRDWCSWCDSMHAVDPVNKSQWNWMEPAEIVKTMLQLAPWCQEVTISGGNPALHDLDTLVDALSDFGYNINVETQATIYRPWLDKCDIITTSPKPPSAGENSSLPGFVDFLRKFKAPKHPPLLCVKVVVDLLNKDDFSFARKVFQEVESANFDYDVPLYLSLKTNPKDTTESLLTHYRDLVEKIAKDKQFSDVHILPQLHVLLWGHRTGV